MSDLPVFTTERLIVRPRALRDLDALVAMDAEPEVMRYIGDGTLPDPQTHRRDLRRRIAEDIGPMLGYWSVATRAAPEAFLGWVCLIPLPGHDLVEIGWRFRAAAWGKGYASEAAQLLVHHAFSAAGLDEIVAVVNADNARSIRVMEKLGLKAAGTCIAYGAEVPIYRMKRPTCS
jgi:RimJ/RimL family protein N-acetyltransferase